MEKLGQPEHRINALGIHYANCGPKLSGRPDQGHYGLCLDLLHTIFSAQFQSPSFVRGRHLTRLICSNTRSCVTWDSNRAVGGG